MSRLFIRAAMENLQEAMAAKFKGAGNTDIGECSLTIAADRIELTNKEGKVIASEVNECADALEV